MTNEERFIFDMTGQDIRHTDVPTAFKLLVEAMLKLSIKIDNINNQIKELKLNTHYHE